ncbi:MAG: type II secretion system protein [Deltaproteobacteria bacterium]|nr:type II secretion system protein [Deltaproteobacteria bacterium]
MVRSKKGFTLVEIMVAIAILGILFVTAIPVYHTWQQRAYGSEAAIMLKQLIDAQIIYYLDNDKFYPDNDRIAIYHDGGMEPNGAVAMVKENLYIEIPQGHFIDYELIGDNINGTFQVIISSQGNFDLFKGASQVYATLDKRGKSEIFYAGE